MIQLPTFAFLSPAPGQGGSATTIIFIGQIALIFVIFWFLLIRPQKQQQKRHEEMLKALKKGDEIATTGGIIGEVVHIKDDRVTIKSGESRLVIQRERIATVLVQKAAETPAA